jgi:hypothetical protein
MHRDHAARAQSPREGSKEKKPRTGGCGLVLPRRPWLSWASQPKERVGTEPPWVCWAISRAPLWVIPEGAGRLHELDHPIGQKPYDWMGLTVAEHGPFNVPITKTVCYFYWQVIILLKLICKCREIDTYNIGRMSISTSSLDNKLTNWCQNLECTCPRPQNFSSTGLFYTQAHIAAQSCTYQHWCNMNNLLIYW